MNIKSLLIALALLWSGSAMAVQVTVNMTGDNAIDDGGLCATAACTSGTGWSTLAGGPLPNLATWPTADSLTFDLDPGTHWFAWHITDTGGPEGLLAEFLFPGGAKYSSGSWEVYDVTDGSFIELATELGANSSHPIWGTIAGISSNAQWIWGSNRSGGADDVWIRTSITVRGDPAGVPAPAPLALLAGGMIGLAWLRRRQAR